MTIKNDQMLIGAFVDLMHALTEHYENSDKAMAVFDAVADIVDPQFKGKVMMQMLRHGNRSTVTISGKTPAQNNAIQCVKTLRELGDLGLKEAKDMYDAVASGRPQVLIISSNIARTECLRRLSNVGMLAY